MSVTGAIMAAGAIGSAVVGSVAASDAAGAQESAAQQAMDFEKQQLKNALDTQNTEWTGQQANEAPFLQAGQQATTQLSSMLAPGGELDKQWTGQFTAPTGDQAAQTPGYQFALAQGEQALQRSAAAQGNLLSSGTSKDLAKYTVGAADTNYQQVYNNQFQQYQQAYNQFQQAQNNKFGRLATMTGVGQTAAGQLGQEGQAMATNVGNIDMTTGQQVAQQFNNKGNAQAMGDIGIGNAISGGLKGIGSAAMVSQMTPMSSMSGVQAAPNMTGSPSMGNVQAPIGNFSNIGMPNVAPPTPNMGSSYVPMSSMGSPMTDMSQLYNYGMLQNLYGGQ